MFKFSVLKLGFESLSLQSLAKSQVNSQYHRLSKESRIKLSCSQLMLPVLMLTPGFKENCCRNKQKKGHPQLFTLKILFGFQNIFAAVNLFAVYCGALELEKQVHMVQGISILNVHLDARLSCPQKPSDNIHQIDGLCFIPSAPYLMVL